MHVARRAAEDAAPAKQMATWTFSDEVRAMADHACPQPTPPVPHISSLCSTASGLAGKPTVKSLLHTARPPELGLHRLTLRIAALHADERVQPASRAVANPDCVAMPLRDN